MMVTLRLSLCFLLLVPGLLAHSLGATSLACSDLMPMHGAHPSTVNRAFFLLGDVFDNLYVPGRTHESKNISILVS